MTAPAESDPGRPPCRASSRRAKVTVKGAPEGASLNHCLARRVGPKIADDLAVEAFLAAFAQRQRFDLVRGCARSWLDGIATNLAGTQR